MTDNISTLSERVDLAYRLQPALGIRERFVDAWRDGMGMALHQMRDSPGVVKGLINIVESPQHPNNRRQMAARLLTEIVEINAQPPIPQEIRSAISKMGETAKLSKTAAGYLDRIDSFGSYDIK